MSEEKVTTLSIHVHHGQTNESGLYEAKIDVDDGLTHKKWTVQVKGFGASEEKAIEDLERNIADVQRLLNTERNIKPVPIVDTTVGK